MERFRKAVEAKDLSGMVAAVTDGIVLHSPILFHPIVGREAVGRVLGAALRVFQDFRYEAALEGSGKHALEFHAKVGELEIQGIDLGIVGADGLIGELTVFVRPLSATVAFQKAMFAALQ